MSRLLSLLVLAAVSSLLIFGCTSDDSSGPTGGGTNDYTVVGLWRSVGYVYQQTAGGSYMTHFERNDSSFMRIDSSGHFVFESWINGTLMIYMSGTGTYNGSTLGSRIDSLYDPSSATGMHEGSQWSSTVSFTNSNNVMISQGTTSNNLPAYQAYLKVGSDVKMGGFISTGSTGNNNYTLLGNVPIEYHINDVTVATTTATAWGFFAFTGQPAGTNCRAHAFINGSAFDDSPITTVAGNCYRTILSQ